jgi:hypothetical protein
MTYRDAFCSRFTLAILLLFALGLTVQPANAEPSFFSSDCAGCHSDDTPTCAGCHNHRGSLSAVADQAEYAPGAAVTVTLSGGSANGWIRALLYDDQNVELYRATGPTGTGDNGQGDPVTFPVQLTASAPTQAGDYVWEAAWFGNNDGSGHLENRTPVTIHVTGSSGVSDPREDGDSTWGAIKSLYK